MTSFAKQADMAEFVQRFIVSGPVLTVTKNLPYSPSLAMKLYMSAAS